MEVLRAVFARVEWRTTGLDHTPRRVGTLFLQCGAALALRLRPAVAAFQLEPIIATEDSAALLVHPDGLVVDAAKRVSVVASVL